MYGVKEHCSNSLTTVLPRTGPTSGRGADSVRRSRQRLGANQKALTQITLNLIGPEPHRRVPGVGRGSGGIRTGRVDRQGEQVVRQ
jgi:hypothetical protein